jgi:hypothetical protein
MKHKLFLLSIILPVLSSCQEAAPTATQHSVLSSSKAVPTRVSEIPPPEGFKRFNGKDSGFARWLRNVPVKKDKTVYLYNGQLKGNQDAQYAVLDIPVGRKDLQQCADAVMRMRASWLYSQGRYEEIRFADNNGRMYVCPPSPDSAAFERYLQTVYSYCGTLSLAQQLRSVNWFDDIQPGDVLIRGGSPGHAVIVMDVVVNDRKQKYYLLAQSYMPAQSIHILKNYASPDDGPWYNAQQANDLISTPEWNFYKNQLKRW